MLVIREGERLKQLFLLERLQENPKTLTDWLIIIYVADTKEKQKFAKCDRSFDLGTY